MNFRVVFTVCSFLFLVQSCSDNKADYFPLKNKNLWAYNILITPSEEDQINYKKTNFSLAKQSIKKDKTIIDVYPVIRENETLYFYSKNKDGIFREAIQHNQSQPISFEEKKKNCIKISFRKRN